MNAHTSPARTSWVTCVLFVATPMNWDTRVLFVATTVYSVCGHSYELQVHV